MSFRKFIQILRKEMIVISTRWNDTFEILLIIKCTDHQSAGVFPMIWMAKNPNAEVLRKIAKKKLINLIVEIINSRRNKGEDWPFTTKTFMKNSQWKFLVFVPLLEFVSHFNCQPIIMKINNLIASLRRYKRHKFVTVTIQ